MRYALLDWDNTLRKGFTLFDCIDFFIKKNACAIELKSEIDCYIADYSKGVFNHDELAKMCCDAFSRSLAAKNTISIGRIFSQYFSYDKEKLFAFVPGLFQLMRNYGIKPIIISGAPGNVIKKYQSEFGIYRIYSYEMQTSNKRYTGATKFNYGYSKEKIVDALVKKYGKPIFGMGDSYSDISLLTAAEHSVLIADANTTIHSEIVLESSSDSDTVERVLKTIL